MNSVAVFLLAGLISLLSTFAHSEDKDSTIIGTWRFHEVEFKGERRPPFSPDLIITFEFDDTGESRLHWTREGDVGFCERKAKYVWDGKVLSEEIHWTNPDNRVDCSGDPDMQVGRTTKTPTTIKNQELKTELNLSGEALYYLWKPLRPE